MHTSVDLDNKTVHKILRSHPVLLLEAVAGVLAFCFESRETAFYVFLPIIMINLVCCRDTSPSLAPFMMLFIVMLRFNEGIEHEPKTDASDFYQFIWIIILLVCAVILHLIFFPPRLVKGKMYLSLILVSVAIFLGGVGSAYTKEYFNATSQLYMWALGPVSVLAYFWLTNYTVKDQNHSPGKTLTRVMMYVGLMLFAALAFRVLQYSYDTGFSEYREPWSFQWQNDFSTFFLFVIPFPFYLAAKLKNIFTGCLLFLTGIAYAAGCMLTLSRGGIIFGLLMLIACAVYSVAASKGLFKKLTYILIFFAIGLTLVLVLLTNEELMRRIGGIVEIEPDEDRFILFKEAWQNFLKYPVFGTGLAYVGPNFKPVPWTIYWYHSTPFQVMACFGTVGIIAFGYQYINRTLTALGIKLKKGVKVKDLKPTAFSVCIFLSYFGYSIMSLVNAGDFAPVMYSIPLIAILTVAEVMNSDATEYYRPRALFKKMKKNG